MSEKNVIIWSAHQFLMWSDFKADSNPAVFEDSHSFLKYHYTWKVNSDKIENNILFFVEDLQIFAEFYPNLSWIRNIKKNGELLKHEQGHFDLAELVKINHLEKIQNKFYKKQFPTRGQNEEQRKQFAKEDSTKLIASEIEKLELILSEKRQEYDCVTNFGQTQNEQSKYDLIFQKLRT